MRWRARAAFLAVVPTLALAPAAAAVQLTDYEHALQVAHAYWHSPPPCGRPDIAVDRRPPAESPDAVSWVRRRADGSHPCEIHYLATTWTWRAFCVSTVHEVGHLHGLEHSFDPQSVMYPHASLRSVPGCNPGARRAPVHARAKAKCSRGHRGRNCRPREGRNDTASGSSPPVKIASASSLS